MEPDDDPPVFMGEGLPPVWAEAASVTVQSETNAERQTRRDIGELTALEQEDRQQVAAGGRSKVGAQANNFEAGKLVKYTPVYTICHTGGGL